MLNKFTKSNEMNEFGICDQIRLKGDWEESSTQQQSWRLGSYENQMELHPEFLEEISCTVIFVKGKTF